MKARILPGMTLCRYVYLYRKETSALNEGGEAKSWKAVYPRRYIMFWSSFARAEILERILSPTIHVSANM